MKHTAVRRTLAAATTFILAGGALAACASPGSDEGSTDGKSIVYAVQSFSHEAIQPIVDAFTKETGIKVELESGPATGSDLLTQLVPAFNSGTTPYDVIDADDPAGAALVAGGWLEPLSDEVTSAYLDDLTPGMAEGHETWNVKDGKTYRLYHNWDVGYAWANEELLAANGLAAPTSWDDMRTVGAALKDKGIYAFGDAASKPGLTFVYLAYLTAQAGGDLYAADAGTRQAFEFAKELIDDGYFPKEALTWTYDQSNAAYMEGSLATMRQWPFFEGVAQSNTAWYSPEKAVIVDPPKGPSAAKTWAGGWGMAIPKASKNKEAAAKFVEYMNSPEVAVQLAEATSFFGSARQSVLDAMGDEGIIASLKHYAESDLISPRPFHPQAAKAESIIDDIGQTYLIGQIDIDEAMDRIKKQIADLG